MINTFAVNILFACKYTISGSSFTESNDKVISKTFSRAGILIVVDVELPMLLRDCV